MQAFGKRQTERLAKDFLDYVANNEAVQKNVRIAAAQGNTIGRMAQRTARRNNRARNSNVRYGEQLKFAGNIASSGGSTSIPAFGTMGVKGVMNTFQPSTLQRLLNIKDPSITPCQLRIAVPVKYQVYQQSVSSSSVVTYAIRNTSSITLGFLPNGLSNPADTIIGSAQYNSDTAKTSYPIALVTGSLSNGWGGGPMSTMYDQYQLVACNWTYIPIIPFTVNGALGLWIDSDPLDLVNESAEPSDLTVSDGSASATVSKVLPPPRQITDIYGNDSVYVGPLNLPASGSFPQRLINPANGWLNTLTGSLARFNDLNWGTTQPDKLSYLISSIMRNCTGKVVAMAESYNDPGSGLNHNTIDLTYGNVFLDMIVYFRNRSMYGNVPITPPSLTVPTVLPPLDATLDQPVASNVAVVSTNQRLPVTTDFNGSSQPLEIANFNRNAAMRDGATVTNVEPLCVAGPGGAKHDDGTAFMSYTFVPAAGAIWSLGDGDVNRIAVTSVKVGDEVSDNYSSTLGVGVTAVSGPLMGDTIPETSKMSVVTVDRLDEDNPVSARLDVIVA